MSTNVTVFGTIVDFSCSNGNKVIGSKSITCLTTGEWSSIPPACERLQCPPIKIAFKDPNILADVSNFKPGSKIKLRCPNGYRLRGSDSGICSHLGNWSLPETPHCVAIHCPRPIAPVNGKIQGKGLVQVGEYVSYVCDKGFLIDGEPTANCVGNGEWSSPAPTCVRACSYPGSPEGGFLDNVRFYYKVGDKVGYSCKPGFNITGARVIMCLETGHWSGPVPTCTIPSPLKTLKN